MRLSLRLVPLGDLVAKPGLQTEQPLPLGFPGLQTGQVIDPCLERPPAWFYCCRLEILNNFDPALPNQVHFARRTSENAKTRRSAAKKGFTHVAAKRGDATPSPGRPFLKARGLGYLGMKKQGSLRRGGREQRGEGAWKKVQ